MHTRALVIASVAVLAVATVGVLPAAGLVPSPAPTFCPAYAEYQMLQALVDQTLRSESATGDPEIFEEALGIQGLTFAPRMVQLTGEMSLDTSRAVRRELKRQLRLLRKGVNRLRQAGLSEEQITSLEAVAFTAGDEAGDLANLPGVNVAELRRHALAFAPRLRDLRNRADRLARRVQAASFDCG